MTDLNELFFLGSKPVPTLLTSGTGTFVPSADNALCRVRLQAGGGGGHTSVAGGGGGAMVEFWLRIPIAGIAYAVGAGGAVSAAGSDTTFGQFTAKGGKPATTTNTPGFGGVVGVTMGSVSATAATLVAGGTPAGVSGGHGGVAAAHGGLVGFPITADGSNNFNVNPAYAAFSSSNGVGNGSGGNAFFGKGGATGVAGAANTGAGGGANAAGGSGRIEIEDFGA